MQSVSGDAPESALDLNFVQPALTGGLALGLLSSVPIINAGNCLCCMWIVGGGGLAAFMLMRQQPDRVTYGDGAFVGVLSGLFGAILATLLSIPIRLLLAQSFESQRAATEEVLKELPGLEGPLREILLRLSSPEVSGLTLLVTFFSNLLSFALFSMIGGILMVAVSKRRK